MEGHDAGAAEGHDLQAWNAKCLVKGYMVPANATAIPAGATAMCKDNTYSMAKGASGRCAGRGGVTGTLYQGDSLHLS
jgi:hypothetical protein